MNALTRRVTVRFDLPCMKDGYTRRECTSMQDEVIASSGASPELIWRITRSMSAVSCLATRFDISLLQSCDKVISVTEEQINHI